MLTFFSILYIYVIALWYGALGVSGLICFGKQFINVVQIVNASKVLVSIDKEDRAKALKNQ